MPEDPAGGAARLQPVAHGAGGACACCERPPPHPLGRNPQQLIIARAARLENLNGARVRARERADAEKVYLKRCLGDALRRQGVAVGEGTVAELTEETTAWLVEAHPRYDELVSLHGHPMVRRAAVPRAARARSRPRAHRRQRTRRAAGCRRT